MANGQQLSFGPRTESRLLHESLRHTRQRKPDRTAGRQLARNGSFRLQRTGNKSGSEAMVCSKAAKVREKRHHVACAQERALTGNDTLGNRCWGNRCLTIRPIHG